MIVYIGCEVSEEKVANKNVYGIISSKLFTYSGVKQRPEFDGNAATRLKLNFKQ